MNNKENSPFTPGSPVPVELFVGRSKQINELNQCIEQTLSGKQENVFLAGDRGIGKSSLASLLRYYVITKKNMLGIHIFLGGVSTLEEMVHHIFDQILKETKEQTWFKNIDSLFGKYIKEIGLFGISISFAPPEEDLKELVKNFPETLNNLLEKIKEQKKGLFIALDDINGLAEKEEFANWYKSFVDKSATHYYKNFPVFIMLIGLPEKRDKLSKLQPSIARIFNLVEIEKLSDEEVKNFLTTAFKKAHMELKDDARDLMVHYSSGLPILMHEIGDAVFWTDKDGIIDKEDAFQGIVMAAEKVGKKYLDPKVYRTIRSKHYRSILKKLGNKPLARSFRKKDVESALNESEKSVFHNFLRKMKELGVIETDIEKERGTYRFVNELYPIYIYLYEKTKKINENNKA